MKSYVLEELNKFGNSNASVISRVTEGLSITIEQRVKLIRHMKQQQEQASDAFSTFTDKVIPFTEKVSDSIEKINNFYGENSPYEVKQVINNLKTVGSGISNISVQTTIEEGTSEENILELKEILETALNTLTIPTECPNFHDNFLYFIDAGLYLQGNFVIDYCQDTNFISINGNELIKKANFFMDFFISDQGSFLHALEPTLRASQSLVDLLNVFL